MYIYKARFIKATADGIDVYLDLGFYIYIKQRVKLYGIKINPEKQKEAVEYITNTLHTYEFEVETVSSKRGKVGRCLGTILIQKTDKKTNIADHLIEQGYAEKFNTSE